MRSILSFFRRKPAAGPPVAVPVDGPEPVEVPLPPGAPNPIHRLLDDWLLPWHQTRAEVTAQVGVSLDPVYQWEALVLSNAVPLPGAITPWTASAGDRIPPQFPVTPFSALVWFEDDAQVNLRRAADLMAATLGPARIGRRWNMLVASWRCGLAEVSLIAWPPAWQSPGRSNPAEGRDHRLRTACHVHVATGFRLPLSAEEETWVKGFEPLEFDGQVGTARMARAGATAPDETKLEYVRDPAHLVDDRQTTLGLSADGAALVVVSNQLFVIPRHAILRLEVTRLTPAKGGGGSSLHAICQTAAPGADGQSIFLAQNSKPDGLNAFAQTLGHRLGCPVDIGPYYPDC